MGCWKTTTAWLLLAAISGFLTLSGLAAHGFPIVPALICVIGAACALHAPTRERVTGKLAWVFSGSAVRSVLIIGGALMLIQLVPLEMALLLAGDVLVYLEALTAISLMAAGNRLAPLRAAAGVRLRTMVARLAGPWRRASRAVRTGRPGGRRPPPSDGGDPARQLAFA